MTELFWQQLLKEIELKNQESGKNYFSHNIEDFTFLRKKKSSNSLLTVSFWDKKSKQQIDINVKVIE